MIEAENRKTASATNNINNHAHDPIWSEVADLAADHPTSLSHLEHHPSQDSDQTANRLSQVYHTPN
jgi:hypothetical protein